MRLDHPLLTISNQDSLAMEAKEARTRVTGITLGSSGIMEVTRTETTTRIGTMAGTGLITDPEMTDPLSKRLWLT
jgi:hypothetical protein